MNPPALSKRTGATVGIFPQVELDGALTYVVVIKQGYRVGRRGAVIPVPGATLYVADEPWEPGKRGSIRYPSDVCLQKPGTDVIVAGDAISPGLQPVRELDVQVEVGPLSKRVRVFGARVWYRGVVGMALTDPLPFSRRELRWEGAFGGLDEPRNPLGVGASSSPETLERQPGPAIEDPVDLIRSPKSRPTPAGLGALGPDFAQRRQYAGTMDTRWQEERFPLRPLDFDARFFQVAPPGLSSPAPLRGGEAVKLHGLHVTGPLTFSLPKTAFGVSAEVDRREVEVRPRLDTVLLEPTVPALQVTWRAVVPCPAQKRRLTDIHVWEKEWR